MLIEEGDGGGGYERSLLQSMLSKSLSIEVLLSMMHRICKRIDFSLKHRKWRPILLYNVAGEAQQEGRSPQHLSLEPHLGG